MAELLGASLKSGDLVSSVQVAGPFVNVVMSDAFFAYVVSDYGIQKHDKKDETIIVDYI